MTGTTTVHRSQNGQADRIEIMTGRKRKHGRCYGLILLPLLKKQTILRHGFPPETIPLNQEVSFDFDKGIMTVK